MSSNHHVSPNHAVVVGGSIAGLCAARVLSDHYGRVTLYERDELPDEPVNRGAIPQGQHVHLLMARGADELEALFPGLLDDMVAANVPVVENRPSSIHFEAGGHLLGTGQTLESNFTAYVPSRGQLEWQIRRRVSDLPNVQILRRSVSEPRYDPGAERVTGLLLDDGEHVAADMVVDASGRGSRLPVWLEQWGYQRPPEETIKVGVTYASQRVRIPAELISEKMVVVSAAHDSGLGMGMLFHEDGIWTVTAFGVAKAEPPSDFTGIKQLGGTALPPHLATALRAGEAVGDMNFHRYPVAKWRRYDKLDRFPDGIFPFGDAVVSLNPTYGQGVTMSTVQAANLRQVLAEGTQDLVRRLARRTAKTTYPVWMMNSVADQVKHGAEGDKAFWYSPLFGLFDQFLGAAETDPVLAEWFLRRTSMLDSLWLTPPPRIVGRAIRHNVKAWLAERRRRPHRSESSVTAGSRTSG
jgi:2-polyprenyl-6-methoxyphenol hydroxylase-like FAD-dependent oxidoreductase